MKRRSTSETDVEYYNSYDAARNAALRKPGLHCYAPRGSKWIQCFMHLDVGACQELAMTPEGDVEEGVTWVLDERGQLRVNPESDDDWDEKTPIEEVLPPMHTWPSRDASPEEWEAFRRKYPPARHWRRYEEEDDDDHDAV